MNDETVNKPTLDQPATHAIDIANLQRSGERMDLAREEIALKVENLRLWYGEKQALKGIDMDPPAAASPPSCAVSTA